MSELPRFSITPGTSNGLAPVHLSMSPGYVATASLTDDCGHAIPGATLTTVALTATPRLPSGYAGTVFVDWRISVAHEKGLGIAMTLASRQVVGHATTCAHTSPYTATTVAPPVQHALIVKPAAAAGMDQAVGGATLAVLVAAAVIVVLWWRRRSRRVRGSHAR